MDESIIGKTIDNYKILAEIGRGGMGRVYKAIDTSLEKIVALKFIDPILARDENFLRRFKTEAKALAKLENVNIVTVYALRETEFGVFMVMEYVEAKTLSDWLRDDGAFSWQDTVQISKQLLNAVGHAHKVGVIHRDIKSSNILLSRDLRVKVTDFGLAKVIQQHGPASTVTQMRAGTLYYMSPEQVKGLKNVDFRSDIYSLGMTLYEMLVGRVPFEKTESDFTIQKQIVDGQIPSPLKFNSSIPKSLVKVITKSIDKDPQRRFQSAEEMRKEIENLEYSTPEKNSVKAAKGISHSFKRIFLLITFIVLIFLGYITIIDPFSFFDTGSMNIEKFKTGLKTGASLLTILTKPTGASVFLNDSSLGLTPLENISVNDRQIKVLITKNGYCSIDTSLIVQTSDINTYNFILKELISPEKKPILGTLEITSRPDDTSIWINNKFIGTTPRENEELKPGHYTLLLRKKGYVEYRESFSVQSGKTTKISAVLEALGTLSVTSQPAGAEIILNGGSIGNTPLYNKELKKGSYQIILRKSGFKDFLKNVEIVPTENSNIFGTLLALNGTLKVLIRPWGSIYVDGIMKEKDTNFQFQTELPVGIHQVKAVHPALGEWEGQIKIESDHTQDIVIDFNREVSLTITSDPNNAEIYIDGKATGKYTPKKLKLRTGKHIILVKKEGYSLLDGAKEISIQQDVNEPLNFSLKKIK
jgi:serine/threonine protein kinase